MEDFEILFVDDDSKILDLVEEYLTAFDYNVSVVDNGLKALEMIKNQDFHKIFRQIGTNIVLIRLEHHLWRSRKWEWIAHLKRRNGP